MNTIAQMPPMQIVCAAPKCRRRQSVPMTDVYTVQVKGRFGGSQKNAACLCRQCGEEIVISASFLRKGVLPLLPSRAQLESSRAPAAALVAAARLPEWSVGQPASDALDQALGRIAANGGDLIGLTLENGVQEIIDLPLERESALRVLDEAGCHLLVGCGPNDDGSTWQVVLHPASGAATLTSAAA